MEISEIVGLLEGKVVCGNELQYQQVEKAFASDLMSDVLTIKADKLLLLTGLVNVQAVRTAEMSDISCIIFARDKQVTSEMAAIAGEARIVVIQTPYSMFRASGVLYEAGIRPVY